MTLPGSAWDKPGTACDPREAMPSSMDTVPQPPGEVGALGGGRREASPVGYSLGCPHRPQGFLALQVLKEAHFVFYGGSPYRPPVSVGKCPCKIIQGFSLL